MASKIDNIKDLAYTEEGSTFAWHQCARNVCAFDVICHFHWKKILDPHWWHQRDDVSWLLEHRPRVSLLG